MNGARNIELIEAEFDHAFNRAKNAGLHNKPAGLVAERAAIEESLQKADFTRAARFSVHSKSGRLALAFLDEMND